MVHVHERPRDPGRRYQPSVIDGWVSSLCCACSTLVLAAADTDRSGENEYDEFVELMTYEPPAEGSAEHGRLAAIEEGLEQKEQGRIDDL